MMHCTPTTMAELSISTSTRDISTSARVSNDRPFISPVRSGLMRKDTNKLISVKLQNSLLELFDYLDAAIMAEHDFEEKSRHNRGNVEISMPRRRRSEVTLKKDSSGKLRNISDLRDQFEGNAKDSIEFEWSEKDSSESEKSAKDGNAGAPPSTSAPPPLG